MNPVAFTIFNLEVRWYGILIAFGVFAAVYAAKKSAKVLSINPENIDDFILIALIPGVIGARLYYVLFNLDFYGNDIAKIINIRNGGLAIHGGLIVGSLVAYIFCKTRKINFLDFFDILGSSVPIAQSIGRWGNFTNGEAHGGPTNLPWAITVDGQKVHPTFLYESIWSILIFIFLNYLIRNRKFKGQILALYLILYSIARFFIEGLRTDSLYFGSFRVAQLISLALIILGILIYYFAKKKEDNGLLS